MNSLRSVSDKPSKPSEVWSSRARSASAGFGVGISVEQIDPTSPPRGGAWLEPALARSVGQRRDGPEQRIVEQPEKLIPGHRLGPVDSPGQRQQRAKLPPRHPAERDALGERGLELIVGEHAV